MTAQIPDEFILNGEKFAVVGIQGEDLINPRDLGIVPRFRVTSCWRGYVMTYIIINDQVILDRMRINTANPIEINKVKPDLGEDFFDYCYNNLNLQTDFTGKLLIAKDFIRSMYVHMGFQRPMAYKIVVELYVEKGKITLSKDLSRKMEGEREQDRFKDANPSSKSQKDIRDWVEKTFSLDYDF